MLQCTEQFSDTLLGTCHGSQPLRRGGLASISDCKSVDHIIHVGGPRIIEGENAALQHSCTGMQPHQPVLAWAPSLVLNCLSDHTCLQGPQHSGRLHFQQQPSACFCNDRTPQNHPHKQYNKLSYCIQLEASNLGSHHLHQHHLHTGISSKQISKPPCSLARLR